jgi:predicted ArsR family transcriptional regulator
VLIDIPSLCVGTVTLNFSVLGPTKSGGSCQNFTTLYSVETNSIVGKSLEPHFGPIPPSAPGETQVRNLSRARARILGFLSEDSHTVSSLAMRTGQHENTIREHLDALVNEELAIKFQSTDHLRGRPAWVYRLLLKGDQSISIEYVGLATALAGSITRRSSHPRDDAIEAGRSWARALVRNSRLIRSNFPKNAVKTNAVAIRRNVISLLTQLGFTPTHNIGLTRNKLTTCPLLDAARQYPDIICNVHLGIIQGALGEFGADTTQIDRADLQPFSEPGSCLLRM